jgi:F-type H+-transporting ATPase subunit delta
MRGTSRASLRDAEERIEPLLTGLDPTAGIDLGGELFSVAALLDSSGALRRALTDPSRESQAKADLVGRILTGKASSTGVDVIAGLARARWSEARDLGDALEHLGAVATLAAAEREGALDAVEDELFRFGRLVEGNRELSATFSDRALPAERKGALVDRLLDGKVHRATLVLVRQAATHPRGRRLPEILADFGQIAARRRQRLVATVTVATPLTVAQRQRLTEVLQRVYESTIWLNVDVDPEVVGGLRIQIGDEVIDASVLSRLDEARRRLAG